MPVPSLTLLGSLGIALVALIMIVVLAKGKLRSDSRFGGLLFLSLILSPVVLAGGQSVFMSSSNRTGGSGLRIDSVPPWARLVPWLTVDGCPKYAPNAAYCANLVDSLDSIMAGALKVFVIFAIDLPNGTRIVLGSVYVSHDADYLYVGVLLHGVYQSPSNNSTKSYATHFSLLFDTKNDGNLSYPEAGARYNDCHIFLTSTCFDGPYVGYYSNLVWMNQTGWSEPQGCRLSGVGDYTVAGGGSNGDFAFFFLRALRTSDHCPNGLQIQPGERWVMGFQMQLGYYGWQGGIQDWVGSWPAPPAFYLAASNSSWWPKLVIDTRT